MQSYLQLRNRLHYQNQSTEPLKRMQIHNLPTLTVVTDFLSTSFPSLEQIANIQQVPTQTQFIMTELEYLKTKNATANAQSAFPSLQQPYFHVSTSPHMHSKP